MSFGLFDLDSFPEPQHGEATISLSVTLAQPKRRGDAEGWRARATCVETGRVIGRWVSDCPLSAVQAALLWLGMHPWEVLPEDGGYDYAYILDQVERPASNDQIHVRDLLERLATNLPLKPDQVVSSITGARILRRSPRALPQPAQEVEPEGDGPEGTPEWGEAPEEDEEGGGEEVEASRVARTSMKRRGEDPAVANKLLRRAVTLLQDGDDPKRLARALEKRGGRSLAETFLAVSGQIARPEPTPSVPEVPLLSPEAEEEIAKYAVGDETAVRAKLERTAQRAARERARVDAFLANKARLEALKASRAPVSTVGAPVSTVGTVQRSAGAHGPNLITLEVHPHPVEASSAEVAPGPTEVVQAPTKPRRGRKKAEVVAEGEAG